MAKLQMKAVAVSVSFAALVRCSSLARHHVSPIRGRPRIRRSSSSSSISAARRLPPLAICGGRPTSSGPSTSRASSRIRRAKEMRASRSMAISGRARGCPNRSTYTLPCSAIASRASCPRSHASQAKRRRRRWCCSRSNSATTAFHQLAVSGRRCGGGKSCFNGGEAGAHGAGTVVFLGRSLAKTPPPAVDLFLSGMETVSGR